MKRFDSIIFDMDGTLWDAVDSYCQIWDKTFSQLEIKMPKIPRQTLLDCMGLPITEIFNRIVNLPIDATKFLEVLDDNEKKMMPILGGRLYDGVFETIPVLSQHYKLFMVSNCGAEGLHNFLSFTKLKQFFSGTLTFGETQKGKSENIGTIIKTNNLKSPVYVGDTQGDCDSAHNAGIPMVFASYGFGKCDNAEYQINKFNQLLDLFL